MPVEKLSATISRSSTVATTQAENLLNPPTNQWDVIIIGGGAAGLMAATSAGQRGKRVLLLEKNRKIGVKILMSGGTRCNITHHCDNQGIIRAFGKQGKFLHSALAALPPLDVIKKIEGQGVATKIESTGKIFPVSNRAIDVRDALVAMALAAGVTILPEHPVLQLQRRDNEFELTTPQGHFSAPSIIITTGGKSYPGCGTTGDGYGWAQQFGHTIADTFPALTPILTSCQWAHGLQGLTLDSVNVRVVQTNNVVSTAGGVEHSMMRQLDQPIQRGSGQILAQRLGSFLFTHWGFSGPAVLDVSREVARHPARKSLELVCDFLPMKSNEQLFADLNKRKLVDGKQSASNLLPELFPRRLQEELLLAAGIATTSRLAELSKKSLTSIVDHIKNARFPISGTLGFEKAEVTSGGVSLSEVDSKTMRSKLTAGLFFAGEILDLDGCIGGFNFQSAFSTGWLAGQWA